MNILAIDDSKDNLAVLKAIIADRLPDAALHTASDGLMGIELAQADDPDVILLDIVMPGMDGYAVCRKMKEDARLQVIPVIFLTALGADRDSRVKALDAGAEGFLSKPIDEIELIAQLRAMAKLKAAVSIRRNEHKRLTALVAERTKDIQQANDAMLNLLEDLKAENILKKSSEEKFSKAFQTSPYAITITRAEDGGFIEVNDAFTSIAGFTRDEALADSSIGLKLWAHEEDREHVVSDLRAGRAVEGREYHFRKKSGENITGLFSAQIIRLNSGPCILSSINDITARKRMEEALSESEKKHRALFETMTEGIVYEDHDGMIISANPAAERLLGLTLDQLQGRTSLDPRWKAIHADGSSFPGETHSLHVAAKTGKPASGEIMGIYNPKSEAYIWLSVNSTPEFLPGDKKPFRAYAVFSDITERKRTEELIRSQLSELQRWQDVMLDREDRVEELKCEVNELCRRLNEPARYPSQEAGAEVAPAEGHES